MIIKSEISISVKDIKTWISKSNSLHSLQSIRAKTNKRINAIVKGEEYNPLSRIPVWVKRIVLQPLFVPQKKIEYKPQKLVKRTMKCQECGKRFGEAGNIRNYEIVCPHCKHIQKSVEKNG